MNTGQINKLSKKYLEKFDEEEESLEEESLKEESSEDFLRKFNKDFEDKIKMRKNKLKKKRKEKIEKSKKNIHDLTIGEILINTQNTYFNIFKEIFNFKYKKGFSNIFTKDDRLFYIGVSLLIISFIIFIISFFIEDEEKRCSMNNDKVNIFLGSSDNNLVNEDPKTINEPKLKKINKPKIDKPKIESETKSEDILISQNEIKLNKDIDTSKLKEVEL